MAKKTKGSATRKRTRSKASKRAPKSSLRSSAALVAIVSSETPVEERVKAMTSLTNSVRKDENSFRTAVNLLTDASQPSPVRLAALQALQAASFSVLSFEGNQPGYTAALHRVMDDSDPELRQRVLGILSAEKDPRAQERLLEGLRNPERASVPPEKALQLLAYDIHAGAYAAARDIVQNPPNLTAKREALRLLASDSESAPLLEQVLRDKSEFAEIRQVCAAALNTLDPARLQRNAREIVMDDTEYPEIQATSLTALNQFGTPESAADPNLQAQVAKLEGSESALVMESARAFRHKYSA